MKVREALNKSPLARRWVCGMGCAKATTRMVRARSEMPALQQNCGAVEASPPLPDLRFAGALGPRSGEPPRCARWHRIVVQATACVARPMIIPILPATRSARICLALP